ncbi:MAG: IclR family transcriptional regulator C-terminal domain-containing protein, partial [bacterium]
ILWTTGGRAILSTYSDEKIDKVLKNVEFIPRTQYSIQTKQELKAELLESRRRGYSVFENEYIVGLESVGAPIRDFTGECLASLSLTGVKDALSKSVQLELLFEAIEEISELIGSAS